MSTWCRRTSHIRGLQGPYTRAIGDVPEIVTALKSLGLPDRPEVRASVIEVLLEGLHVNKRLNKDEVEGRAILSPLARNGSTLRPFVLYGEPPGSRRRTASVVGPRQLWWCTRRETRHGSSLTSAGCHDQPSRVF